MAVVKIVVWEEEGVWMGHLQEYPDYWTQGESLEDLKEHLKDLHAELSAGTIPGARRVDDLIVS
jgi:predicted RNase H-like HicB family nuclease